jgi:murein DD-endopeptidase MepM/ murein hydrolase activator NlpD
MHFPFARGRELSDDNDDVDITTPAYQCTQSENGQLTHFFHGNYHSIDFACPIGTPLYSPVNGKVVEVLDRGNSTSSDDTNVAEVSGIAARNMFYWNSIMVQAVDENGGESQTSTNDRAIVEQQQQPKAGDPLYVEFVHIQTNSCVVQVGDVVKKGQLLCWSGNVGFTPEPHLHFAAYRSNGKDAATVRVKFDCEIRKKEGTDGKDKVLSPSNRAAGGELLASSFLPRAGGWYNRNGLIFE